MGSRSGEQRKRNRERNESVIRKLEQLIKERKSNR